MFRVILLSCISLVVSKDILGTAVGVNAALLNGAMTVIPILVGIIDYKTVSIFFSLMSGLGLACAFILSILDTEGVLNRKPTDKNVKQRQMSMLEETYTSFIN